MQNSSPVRKHSTPAQREKILQAYQRSQLTQKEFAREVGVGVSTLASFCLQWPGGLSLEIHPGFSSAELATLLQLLPKP